MLSTDDASPASGLVSETLAMEYASLRHPHHLPLGIYVLPDEASLLIWQGVWFLHQGFYANSVLKFKLVFPPNYPDAPPALQFITQVFHPLVREDGLINMEGGFSPWRPREHHVHHVLHWLKAAFKKEGLAAVSETQAWNKEAYR
ncbi:UBC-like protein [Sistotremastrum suecicum HHB10207 ss-3]|nr:UBC-like protein [Sistotremastrum suecicum HHB10207 ss-3]